MKYHFFFCIIFFHTFFVQSQTLEELNNHIAELNKTGEFSKAIPFAEKALVVAQNNPVGKDHPDYVISLYNLGVLLIKVGKYREAESFLIEVREKINFFLGQHSIEYAAVGEGIAELYIHINEYEKAEQVIQQSINIIEKIPGQNDLLYAKFLSLMGNLYMETGQYHLVEPLYIRTKNIREKLIGELSPEYAVSLINLGIYYKEVNHYEKAESFISQAEKIFRKVLGESHPDYASCLNTLATLYMDQGLYKKAEVYYIAAVDIWEKVLGENHPDYAISLNNLAELYRYLGLYDKAKLLLLKTIKIKKTALGEDNVDYAISINNLAALYEDMGDFSQALPLYINAKEIRKKILGEKHPDYAVSLDNIAGVYMSMGLCEKAYPLLIESRSLIEKNIKNAFLTLSEKEKEFFIKWSFGNIDSKPNSLLVICNQRNGIQISNYNQQLYLKSLMLQSTKRMIDASRLSQDDSVKKIFNEWLNNKKKLAKEYSLNVKDRLKNIDSIETDTENKEKELNRRSATFYNQKYVINITTEIVNKALKENEAAIEFVKFQLYNNKRANSVIYAAYILKKNDSIPLFVPLFEENQLQQLLDSAGKSATSIVNSFYRGLDLGTNGSNYLGEALYKLIWQPLEPYLKGIKKISYSPAGKLYSIAFQALPVDSKTLLMDKYDLQQYTSTRQVALRSEEKQTVKPTEIVLFGNASFSMDSMSLAKNKTSSERTSTTIYTPKRRGDNNGTWTNLPGTAEEVKKIKALFDQNKISTKSFTTTTATEENLKALDGRSPQILHIATHGFFLPDPEKKKKEMSFGNENTYSLADDPLLRSGLILAGGNYAWSGKTPIDGVEDGIATAYEISQLNLSNTELVVLSACETALGDVKGSEGVFGLQRAFKMAGVKKMIVSLWQVPDKETAELMTSFYSYWLKGKTIVQSFTQAQADMRKKYSPYYWAAFVLVE